MSSNNEVISSALRLIGILAEGETASAEQGADALKTMNDLFLMWDAEGIDIGFYPQTDITADSPIPDEYMRAAKYNLAIELASDYARDPRPVVAAVAVGEYQRLQRDAVIAKLAEADMKHLPGIYRNWDIETGYF